MQFGWTSKVCFLMAVAASSLQAGHDGGNGGHSLTCFDTSKHISSIEFFDLWYARQELQLSLSDATADANSLARETVLKLFQVDRKYFDGLLVSYADVVHAQVKLQASLQLIPPSAFLGNVVPSPATGCEILPLAVYADSGVLLTAGEPWDYLQKSPTGKLSTAAFLVHESLGNMLRRRELASLPEGTVVTEEVRKRIARDTVNITALAFSKISAKQLSHRLERYWKTGDAMEQTRSQRVDSKTLQWTEKPYDYGGPAYKDAMEICKRWLANELARLQPLSEFALGECGEGTTRWSGSDNFRGYATASITAVPKVLTMKFRDAIRSSFLPGYNGALPEQAWQDFLKRETDWKTSLEKRFGNRLYLAHHGETVKVGALTRQWRWHYTWDREYRSGVIGVDGSPNNLPGLGTGDLVYDTRSLGEWVTGVGEVYLKVDSADLVLHDEPLSGEGYQFYAPANEGTEREAARMALESYEKACAAWQEKQYQAGAVFASCAKQAPDYVVEAYTSSAYFHSAATAYFYDK